MPFKKGHTLWNHPNCKKSQFKSGEVRHVTPHSEESKLKISESRKGKTLGERNPSWKGGITPLLIKIKRLTEYKMWQKRVFQRDDYTCRSCSTHGCKTLTAHHLVSFSFIVQMLKVRSVDEAREQTMLWNIRNGVTLCEDCHKGTSNFAWRANKRPRDRAIYSSLIIALFFLFPSFSNAATFGYTSVGASTCTVNIFNTSDGKYVTLDALSDSSRLVQVTANVKVFGPSFPLDFRGIIYEESPTLNPGALLASTISKEITSATFSLVDFPMNGVVDLTANNYFVGMHAEYSGTGGANASVSCENIVSRTNYQNSDTFSDGASNPYGATSTIAFEPTIYATTEPFPHTIRINNGTIRINNGTIDL